MPALPDVPGVLRVFMEGFVDNEDIYKWGNVLHFSYSGPAPPSAACINIGTQIGNAWVGHMSAECPANTNLVNVSVTDLTSPTSGGGVSNVNVFGSRGDDSIPANAAVLISYEIPYRYRGGHPRSYLYAGGNADLEGAAKWSTAFTAEVLAHWQAFLTACLGISISGTSLNQLVCVRYRDATINPTPPHKLVTPLVIPLNIGVALSHQEIASQRRRVGRRKS